MKKRPSAAFFVQVPLRWHRRRLPLLAVPIPADGIVRAALLPLAHLLHGAVGALPAMAFPLRLLLLLHGAVLRRLAVLGFELLLLLRHRNTFLLAADVPRAVAGRL
jgi:hypothetical protein